MEEKLNTQASPKRRHRMLPRNFGPLPPGFEWEAVLLAGAIGKVGLNTQGRVPLERIIGLRASSGRHCERASCVRALPRVLFCFSCVTRLIVACFGVGYLWGGCSDV